MLCLHGKEATSSTTENGNFWFCNQYPKCRFVCSEEESYLYERAMQAFLAVNQVPPRCCVLEDPDDTQDPGKPREYNFAKFCVVKDPEKESYGRPFFMCSKKDNRCEYFEWGDEVIKEKPLCKHGKRCRIWKVKKQGPNHGRSFLCCPQLIREKQCNFFKWVDPAPVRNPIKNTFDEENDDLKNTFDEENDDPFTTYVPKFYADYRCTSPKRVRRYK